MATAVEKIIRRPWRVKPEAFKRARKRTYDRKWTAANPEKKSGYNATYYAANKHKKRAREKARRARDPSWRLSQNLRCRLALAVREQGAAKHANTMALVGCSLQDLKAHLESQFADGMTWENYGMGGWHVDHIKPCDSFDLTDPQQQLICFHWSNLRPLWEIDNLRKGAKSVDTLTQVV